MRPVSVVVLAALAAVAPGGASMAQDASLKQDGSRFSVEKSDEGYVRMDRRTGVMSICKEDGGRLVCRLAADDRDAYEAEVERLGRAVEALEKRVAALEAQPSRAGDLPTEGEFEQSMEYMERFFRRFMGVVQDLEKTFKDEPAEPAPDRT